MIRIIPTVREESLFNKYTQLHQSLKAKIRSGSNKTEIREGLEYFQAIGKELLRRNSKPFLPLMIAL